MGHSCGSGEGREGEASSPGSLALVGGANIGDSQESPALSPHGGIGLGNRDFLGPTEVGGVRRTQGSPFLCLPDTCSSLSRKEEVTG